MTELTRDICPSCGDSKKQRLMMHAQQFTEQTSQIVVACPVCGMVYADRSPEIDYANESKYAIPGATGEGESEQEQRRLDELVGIIRPNLKTDSKIMDVGCARGGLLQALRRAGLVKVVGLDPSIECVTACLNKGVFADHGNLSTMDSFAIKGVWDCIILSHVLEHLWDVPAALRTIERALAPNGIAYIEVPDALKYEARIPFLEVNREHVNHFSLTHLIRAITNAGLDIDSAGNRYFVHFSTPIPSVYVIARKPVKSLSASIGTFLYNSQLILDEMDHQLQRVIKPGEEIIVYGNGEFAQSLMKTRAIGRARIRQILDRNPKKGENPKQCLPTFPIVIASVVNRESIQSDITRLGLLNPVITVGE